MANLIVGGILLILVGSAVAYIVKEKKNGTKCIGCPSGGSCPGHKGGSHTACGCGCRGTENMENK